MESTNSLPLGLQFHYPVCGKCLLNADNRSKHMNEEKHWVQEHPMKSFLISMLHFIIESGYL